MTHPLVGALPIPKVGLSASQCRRELDLVGFSPGCRRDGRTVMSVRAVQNPYHYGACPATDRAFLHHPPLCLPRATASSAKR